MTTLAEIESAAEALTPAQKQQLLIFLVSKLRQQGNLPQPRNLTAQQTQAWIDEDQADMRRFREKK